MRYLATIALLLMATPCFAVLTKTYTVCEGGSCDYTTVAAAETAHNQDLVANDSALTFEIQNTWVSAEGQIFIGGWTTDATRFLTVRAVGAAKAGATWSTTVYRTVHSSTPLTLQEDFTVIDGIQVNCTQTGTSTVACITITIAGNCVIINCFLKGNTGANIRGLRMQGASSTVNVVRNNVIIDCPLEGMIVTSASAGSKVDNNTIENCGVGILVGDNDAIARNNIIWNCTTPLSGTFVGLSEENYTDAGSLSYGGCGSCGTGDQLSQSDPFVSIAGEDYHLASGATAIDAGKDLSADFTDDIDGDTRDANFDKGADEFIAAVGGQKVMIRK